MTSVAVPHASTCACEHCGSGTGALGRKRAVLPGLDTLWMRVPKPVYAYHVYVSCLWCVAVEACIKLLLLLFGISEVFLAVRTGDHQSHFGSCMGNLAQSFMRVRWVHVGAAGSA